MQIFSELFFSQAGLMSITAIAAALAKFGWLIAYFIRQARADEKSAASRLVKSI